MQDRVITTGPTLKGVGLSREHSATGSYEGSLVLLPWILLSSRTTASFASDRQSED